MWDQGEATQLINNIRISPTNDAMPCLSCSGCASALRPELGRGWSLGHSPSLEELCAPVMSFHIPFESSGQQTKCWTCVFLFCYCSLWQVSEVVGDRTSGVLSLFSVCGAFRWWFCIDCITPLGPTAYSFSQIRQIGSHPELLELWGWSIQKSGKARFMVVCTVDRCSLHRFCVPACSCVLWYWIPKSEPKWALIPSTKP